MPFPNTQRWDSHHVAQAKRAELNKIFLVLQKEKAKRRGIKL